ncbi:hypothetical protein RDWZM_005320 [Blomia tropicalis]|uniref:Dishevelled n=1 Tax=Blomia tropicalis TaxID=40697 RepID=A0A9Q0M6K4_BLOTA|nr:hypothetical protein RDWZM_005320 [Blomia tropicalis]
MHQQTQPELVMENSSPTPEYLENVNNPSSPQLNPQNRSNIANLPKLNEIRRPPSSTNETKVIYHLEDKDCPTVIKIPIAPEKITLRDLKTFLGLPKSYFRFYFKSYDKDVGVVKEQIFDDNSELPFYQGKVVAFIETAENGNSPEMVNRFTRSEVNENKRHGLTSDSTFHPTDHCGESITKTEPMISSRRSGQFQSPRHRAYNCKSNHQGRYGKCSNRYHRSGDYHGHYADSSVVTSDKDSYVDSDDDYDDDFMENDVDYDDDYEDYSSRVSTTTEETSVSRQYGRKPQHTRRRYKTSYRNTDMSRTSSVSSFSQMSLNVITVNLNLDVVNYLGISLVGQTSQNGDGGIYVSSILKGGAVDLDGRIEPGDMILQVNDINFDQLTNDEAVQVIREAAKQPGPIKLLIAKCWDPQPKGYFTIPRSEPVRPIDPGAWVAHTEAARAKYTSHDTSLPLDGLVSSYGGSNTMPASIADSEHPMFKQPQMAVPPVPSFADSANSLSNPSSVTYMNSLLRSSFKSGHNVTIAPNPTTIQVSTPLTTETSLEVISCAMASPDSGLDIRERMWMKIPIPNAFIGSDLVHWLHSYVQGFRNEKDAKKFASKLLKQGYIQHPINLKNSFSEKRYYVFSEMVLQKRIEHPWNNSAEYNPNVTNQSLAAIEDSFSNGLRLTDENFKQISTTIEPTNFGNNQHFGAIGSNIGLPGIANQQKPGQYMMPFMRYWDETSEIHNYGMFGPQANVELGGGGGGGSNGNPSLNDGTGSNHSGSVNQPNCVHDPYQSDEQMSQRSGQSVLYNPQAGQHQTNTIASSGSSESRHTNASNQHPMMAGKVGNNKNKPTTHIVSGNGNILNHHYEDLQMNPTTGSLVPTSSIGQHEMEEYHQQQQFGHNGMVAVYGTQPYIHNNNGDVESGSGGGVHSETNDPLGVSNGGNQFEGGTNYDSKNKSKKGVFSFLNRQGSLNGQSNVRNSFRKAMGK